MESKKSETAHPSSDFLHTSPLKTLICNSTRIKWPGQKTVWIKKGTVEGEPDTSCKVQWWKCHGSVCFAHQYLVSKSDFWVIPAVFTGKCQNIRFSTVSL